MGKDGRPESRSTPLGPSATGVVSRVLSANPKRTIVDPSLAPAGVLVLLYEKDGEYCVLMNKRTNHVEHHKGEVSFPGGSQNEEDLTLLDTALRETREEMGILPEDVEVLGELDDTPTTSRFLISPYVGTIRASYEFEPNDMEVAEVLEVPISALMDQSAVRREVRLVENEPVTWPAYAHRGHLIFGATAKVLDRFLELLRSVPEKEALWETTRPRQ